MYFSLEHLLKLVVGEESVALVTHPVLLGVYLAEAAGRLAAILADCLATAFAVVLENHPDASKRLTAQHAESGVQLLHRVKVKYLRKSTVLFLILKKDAVHLKGAGLFPAGRTSITVFALAVVLI